MSLLELRHELDWRLQNILKFSAPVLKRTGMEWRALLSSLTTAQETRLHELGTRYDLSSWPRVCTRDEMLLNLYTLDISDRYFSSSPQVGRALDIGAGNWSYLPAQLSWSRRMWDAVELDAHRRYWTLSTRRAHAAYMMRLCTDCRYFAGSLLDVRDTYSIITWFLPYVLPVALRAGGLPQRYFQPRELLAHAWSLLAAGGVLFIVNQGITEEQEQLRLCHAAGIEAQPLGELSSAFSRFTKPRFGWRIVRTT